MFYNLPLICFDLLLSWRRKTLPQVLRGAILHKNKKVSENSETWFWAENETRAHVARGQFLANYITPPTPDRGYFGVARGESRFLLQAKPPLSKGGLEGLSIWSRTLPRNAQKKDSFLLSFLRWAENESLSTCSPLCISSNCLCPVLYSQFEGHLGCFKVSFSSPTFAIQTSELQLLTTNLRIIFELTKSKRDGLYL